MLTVPCNPWIDFKFELIGASGFPFCKIKNKSC